MIDWLELLRAKVEEKGVVQVARELGYRNHTGVCLVLKGKYPGRLHAIQTNVLATYHTVRCTHTGEEIAPAACRRRALAPRPFGGAAKLAQWECCQGCEHKPKGAP